MSISLEEFLKKHGDELTEEDLTTILKHNLDIVSKDMFWYIGALFPMFGIYIVIAQQLLGNIYAQIVLGVIMILFLALYPIVLKIYPTKTTQIYNEYLNSKIKLREMRKLRLAESPPPNISKE